MGDPYQGNGGRRVIDLSGWASDEACVHFYLFSLLSLLSLSLFFAFSCFLSGVEEPGPLMIPFSTFFLLSLSGVACSIRALMTRVLDTIRVEGWTPV